MTKSAWSQSHARHVSPPKVTMGNIFGASTSNGWWTDFRKSQLAYVMTKFNDLDKAGRVTGSTRNICWREWQQMHEAGTAQHYADIYVARKQKETQPK